jgi:tRNA (mo5U34)-methyltransferase
MLTGGQGFHAIAQLIGSHVQYRRLDALDLGGLGDRFDVVLCMGILHRVTDPVGLLRTVSDVLAPGGEIVLETYGSRQPPDACVIEVHQPGGVYARDAFVYWGFTPRALQRLAQIAGLGELQILDQPQIDGHPRILARLHAATDS